MARIVASGKQNFEDIIVNDYFYIDKTSFIKEWWESGNDVTLIARPRRFGKTLTMNMVEHFFSVKYEGQGELFEGLEIWKDEKYRKLQGTYPVISISFSGVKGNTYEESMFQIQDIISELYLKNRFLKTGGFLEEVETAYFDRMVRKDLQEVDLKNSLHRLCDFMQRFYGRKAIVLLDEYDTPMQEAYVCGYWDKMLSFLRGLFHSTFKTNPYLGRAVMTGITRVGKESIFSDLNNVEVVTVTSNKYRDSFGFTQEEVSAALQEFGLTDYEEMVRDWYDGFTFGGKSDIYNPWSIANFLEKRRFQAYWVNTSSNSLVDELIRKGNIKVKLAMEDLLRGNTIHVKLDEQIVFSQLNDEDNDDAIWSLLLASGYLKAEHWQMNMETCEEEYELGITNKEVLSMFRRMIQGWFSKKLVYNDFVKALLADDCPKMNDYMNEVAMATFSYFDTGKEPSEKTEPERFYHGFVLGLIVDLADRYEIRSNRESGFGRYDVMLEPRKRGGENAPAIIIEFKVRDPKREGSLQETAETALAQIREKKYASALLEKGMRETDIREYGFAFEGKNVLIDGGAGNHTRERE